MAQDDGTKGREFDTETPGDREDSFHDRQLQMTVEAIDEADRSRAELDEEAAEAGEDPIRPAFRVYYDEPR